MKVITLKTIFESLNLTKSQKIKFQIICAMSISDCALSIVYHIPLLGNCPTVFLQNLSDFTSFSTIHVR